MSDYTIYRDSDGQITNFGSTSSPGLKQAPSGHTLVWQKCPEDHHLWRGENGALVQRPQTEIDTILTDQSDREFENKRRIAKREVERAFLQAEEAMLEGVPLSERLSFTPKEEAARAHLAGTATTEQIELLQAELDVTGPHLGESMTDLANRILVRAAEYRTRVGQIAGLRRIVWPAIEAATTEAELQTALTPLAQLSSA